MSSTWKEVRVDGGLVANDWLMQFQSDLLDVPLVRPRCAETTAMGAAMIAGIGAGVWKNIQEVQKFWQSETIWTPSMNRQERATLVSFASV
jgi:glycerol kinase